VTAATPTATRLLAAAALALAAFGLAGCGGGGAENAASSPATTAAQANAVPADAVVRTSEGAFTIRLDAADSPHTVASFERLARKGFYDGLVFHRIVPGFVIQGGDPNGDGTGGPGYTTVDPPPDGTRYVEGVVAMAKRADEPAGTAGSQFFVVTGADIGLPPDYAVLGKVVSGMATVRKIGTLGDPQTEQPTRKVTIETISIDET
jgi:peptidyl-prolyl cis-trans isomerase B (cyclophilin B)